MASDTGDKIAPGAILVVGLGNPGPKYELTRHNAGFLLVDRLADRWRMDVSRERWKAHVGGGQARGRRIHLLKPQTFMNLSGQSVSRAATYLDVGVGNMIVAHDDVDLPFGAVRLKRGGGAGGHKGLRSIDGLMGDKGYFRLRLGVGRPERGDVAGYVLKRFDEMEMAELSDWLDRASDATESLIDEGLRASQNTFHGTPGKR